MKNMLLQVLVIIVPALHMHLAEYYAILNKTDHVKRMLFDLTFCL